MRNQEIDILKYFITNNSDENWGISCTTVGFEEMKTRDNDPVLLKHPEGYGFKSDQVRTLNEYQLIYIVEGSGVFRSASISQTKINAGTMIFIFPDEWHSYYPDPNIGWKEYWIGFKGNIIDNRTKSGYFSKKQCICKVGYNETLINLYKEVISNANNVKPGSSNYISSVAQHILGFYYYKNLNSIANNNNRVMNMLNKACVLIQNNFTNELSLEEIAQELGVGYSWFRRMFRKYLRISPAQYRIQFKIIKIKELLTSTDLAISEIAYFIGFESKSQLSTFFKKHEGISPSEFRKINQ